MALPSSGQLTFNQINVFLGNSSGSQASLRSMSSAASFSTPDAVSDFYGYSPAQDIDVNWGAFVSSGNYGYRPLIIDNMIAGQEISVDIYAMLYIADCFWTIESKINSGSWILEAAGSYSYSTYFSVDGIVNGDTVLVRLTPYNYTWNITGDIDITGGSVTSGTVVNVYQGSQYSWYVTP